MVLLPAVATWAAAWLVDDCLLRPQLSTASSTLAEGLQLCTACGNEACLTSATENSRSKGFTQFTVISASLLQVSGSQDYRLQQHVFADTTLPEILDTARSQQRNAKELQRGMMQIGPEGQGRLEAAWEDIARSGASQVP